MSSGLFDPQCYELAAHFLGDDDVSDMTLYQQEQRLVSLAKAIQVTVEDWMEDEPGRRPLATTARSRAANAKEAQS